MEAGLQKINANRVLATILGVEEIQNLKECMLKVLKPLHLNPLFLKVSYSRDTLTS